VAGHRPVAVPFLQDRDYIGVQGLVTFYALFVVFVSLLIDVVSRGWTEDSVRMSDRRIGG